MSEQLSRTQNRLDSFLINGDSVLVKLNSGQGSLGLMLNDPSLYRNSDSLLTQLRALVADVHKNPGKFLSVRIF
jgi:phospholipid/cholesterol/gamma-HCH transport system substrate-binding protein